MYIRPRRACVRRYTKGEVVEQFPQLLPFPRKRPLSSVDVDVRRFLRSLSSSARCLFFSPCFPLFPLPYRHPPRRRPRAPSPDRLQVRDASVKILRAAGDVVDVRDRGDRSDVDFD